MTANRHEGVRVLGAATVLGPRGASTSSYRHLRRTAIDSGTTAAGGVDALHRNIGARPAATGGAHPATKRSAAP
jgi:hypothetical protein